MSYSPAIALAAKVALDLEIELYRARRNVTTTTRAAEDARANAACAVAAYLAACTALDEAIAVENP